MKNARERGRMREKEEKCVRNMKNVRERMYEKEEEYVTKRKNSRQRGGMRKKVDKCARNKQLKNTQ